MKITKKYTQAEGETVWWPEDIEDPLICSYGLNELFIIPEETTTIYVTLADQYTNPEFAVPVRSPNSGRTDYLPRNARAKELFTSFAQDTYIHEHFGPHWCFLSVEYETVD